MPKRTVGLIDKETHMNSIVIQKAEAALRNACRDAVNNSDWDGVIEYAITGIMFQRWCQGDKYVDPPTVDVKDGRTMPITNAMPDDDITAVYASARDAWAYDLSSGAIALRFYPGFTTASSQSYLSSALDMALRYIRETEQAKVH
jgi:hypothetical protein